MHRANLLLLNQARQIRAVTMTTRFRDDQGGSGHERPPEFPAGDIETEGGFLQNPVIRSQGIGVLHPQQPVH